MWRDERWLLGVDIISLVHLFFMWEKTNKWKQIEYSMFLLVSKQKFHEMKLMNWIFGVFSRPVCVGLKTRISIFLSDWGDTLCQLSKDKTFVIFSSSAAAAAVTAQPPLRLCCCCWSFVITAANIWRLNDVKWKLDMKRSRFGSVWLDLKTTLAAFRWR